MWMSAVSLTVVWLWKSGSLTRLGTYPVGSLILPILVVITVLCRSTGALLLMISGLSTLWLCTRLNSKLFMWALLLVAPSIMRSESRITGPARISRTWSGRTWARNALIIRVSPGE